METIKRIIKNVLGKTQAECKAKLTAAMEAAKGVDISRADEYTVATWLRSWYDIYAGPLRCGLHSPHLHPRYPPEARRGRADHGQLHGTGDVSQSKRDERTEYPSAHLSPFPRISACGSGCGSTLTHTLTHRLNWSKSKEKALLSIESRAFWSCWADSNRRPHPYQGCALPTELQQHNVATKKGLEPSTSSVTGWRSNQLNYLAIYAFVLKLKLAYYSKNIPECQHPFYIFRKRWRGDFLHT